MTGAYSLEEFYGTVYRRFGSFVSAYDGDSLTFDVDLGDYLKFDDRSVRLYGVDTPEKAPKWENYGGVAGKTDPVQIAAREVEKAAAIEALDRVNAYMLASENVIVVQTIKLPGKPLYDKYGRILGKIWVPIGNVMIDLSSRLLVEKHARPYFGGKKPKWDLLRPLGVDDPLPEEVALELEKILGLTGP